MLVGVENSLNASAVRLSIADSPTTQSISLNLAEASDLNLQNGQVIRGFLKDGEILLKAAEHSLNNGSPNYQLICLLSLFGGEKARWISTQSFRSNLKELRSSYF